MKAPKKLLSAVFSEHCTAEFITHIQYYWLQTVLEAELQDKTTVQM